MVRFDTQVPEGVLGASFTGGTCFVDAHLTPQLEAEGLARELLRRVQEMRKEQELDIDAVAPCSVEAAPDLTRKLVPHADEIAKEARVKLSFGPAAGGTEWTVRNPVRGAEEKMRVKLG
jgi:isoleucyl-tRNA synthetase